MSKKKKKEERNKWIIPIIIIIATILLFLFLNRVGIISIDVSSHGHGNYSTNVFSSIAKSLGLMQDYDYIDDETGEGFCFDDECWDRIEAEYDECVRGSMEFSAPEILSYIEITPSVCAIVTDEPDVCEEEYETSLRRDCPVRCESENYVWDGRAVTDLGDFSRTAFPDSMEIFEMQCTFFIVGGEWVSQPDKVGCIDGGWIWCDSNSLNSAKDVCELIGKVWICDGTQATCSNS